MASSITAASLIFLLSAQQEPSEPITISFDISQPKQTLAILADGVVTDDEFADYVKLPQNQALIRKAQQWEKGYGSEELRRDLDKAVRGEDGRSFHFDWVLENQHEVGELLQRLESEEADLVSTVSARLSPYLSPSDRIDIDAVMLLGGYSAGFTLGGSTKQYIGLQFSKNDFNGLQNTLVHEGFHNIHNALSPDIDYGVCLTGSELSVVQLLSAVFREGAAEYAADIWKAGDGAKLDEYRQHAVVNDHSLRRRNTEALIQHTALNLYRDPEADMGFLYNILFEWPWNNPAYYYGYTMSKELLDRDGNEHGMSYYLSSPSTRFFRDYLAINDSGEFGNEFRDLVNRLDDKIAACAPPVN